MYPGCPILTDSVLTGETPKGGRGRYKKVKGRAKVKCDCALIFFLFCGRKICSKQMVWSITEQKDKKVLYLKGPGGQSYWINQRENEWCWQVFTDYVKKKKKPVNWCVKAFYTVEFSLAFFFSQSLFLSSTSTAWNKKKHLFWGICLNTSQTIDAFLFDVSPRSNIKQSTGKTPLSDDRA